MIEKYQTNPLDLINHIRQCDLGEVRGRLEKLQDTHPVHYVVVRDFIFSCKPKQQTKG